MPPRLIPDLIGLKGDTSDNIPGVPGIGEKTAALAAAAVRGPGRGAREHRQGGGPQAPGAAAGAPGDRPCCRGGWPASSTTLPSTSTPPRCCRIRCSGTSWRSCSRASSSTRSSIGWTLLTPVPPSGRGRDDRGAARRRRGLWPSDGAGAGRGFSDWPAARSAVAASTGRPCGSRRRHAAAAGGRGSGLRRAYTVLEARRGRGRARRRCAALLEEERRRLPRLQGAARRCTRSWTGPRTTPTSPPTCWRPAGATTGWTTWPAKRVSLCPSARRPGASERRAAAAVALPLAARAGAGAARPGHVGPASRTSSCRSPGCSSRWRRPASTWTATGWGRSPARSRTRWRSSRPASTSWPASSSTSARRSSWAGSSSSASDCPASARPRPATPPTPRPWRACGSSHPIVGHLLNHRELSKLMSTYLLALPQCVDARTGRLHTTFHQTVAATGRLSSSDPNLQNIPVRTALGAQITAVLHGRAGQPAGGGRLLADRAAHHGPPRRGARAAGGLRPGARTSTAAPRPRCSAWPPDEVDTTHRRYAKAVNFGIMYGISAFGLSQNLGIEREEAAAYIQRYFERLPRVKAFIEETIEIARRQGYVTTVFGRRRPIPELTSAQLPGAVAGRAAGGELGHPGQRRRHHQGGHDPLPRPAGAGVPRGRDWCCRCTTNWCSRRRRRTLDAVRDAMVEEMAGAYPDGPAARGGRGVGRTGWLGQVGRALQRYRRLLFLAAAYTTPHVSHDGAWLDLCIRFGKGSGNYMSDQHTDDSSRDTSRAARTS